MNFRTELHPHTFPFQISHKSKIVSIGSCFADMIGNRLQSYKFEVCANPFGNIYNPISLHNILDTNANEESHYIENQGVWLNYNFHSEIAAFSKESLTSVIDEKKNNLAAFLNEADVLVLTYGTAWIYQLVSDKQIVANCHKQPTNLFIKKLLTVEEIEKSFSDLISNLPLGKNIILTVSPVRHIKDTLALNTVSKSILRLATHKLASTYENVHYFPAFELLMDDLRDYRFYKKDLIHPNEIAEDYIWNKFSEVVMNVETLQWLKILDEINMAVNHKPFQAKSEQHQQFLRTQIKKIEYLQGQLNFDNELKLLKGQLGKNY